MKNFVLITLLVLMYQPVLCLHSSIICRYQNEEGYPMPLYTLSEHVTPMGQMYPLAVAAHAYNGEKYFGPAFSADFELNEASRAYFAERLHTDISAEKFTLSVQMAASAYYQKEQVSLKPQWAFFNDIPLTTRNFDIGGTVECHALVTDDTSVRELHFPSTYVNIHGDANPYVYRLSGNTHPLGFDTFDGKTRGILYCVKFSNGKGFAASLNGQTKVGLIILNGKPLVAANEELDSCVGKPISALGEVIPPCGQDETLSVLGIKQR